MIGHFSSPRHHETFSSGFQLRLIDNAVQKIIIIDSNRKDKNRK